MHHYPDEGSWPFAEKVLQLMPNKKKCTTCKGDGWFYCSGKTELNCEGAELEHIHICYECTKVSSKQ